MNSVWVNENLVKIKAEIAAVCAAANSSEQEITIVAATKTIPQNIIAKLPQLGIKIAGENRSNELCEKYFDSKDLQWHFVGALQTNKVKYVIDKVTVIQSVDRQSLAKEIDKQSKSLKKITDVFIEINIGGEEAKSGVLQEGFESLYEYARSLKNIRVTGIMTVMPIGASKSLYIKMNEIFCGLKAKDNNIKYLSMGMSGDYLTAIECGSNMVRLGRVLFGERDYLAVVKK